MIQASDFLVHFRAGGGGGFGPDGLDGLGGRDFVKTQIRRPAKISTKMIIAKLPLTFLYFSYSFDNEPPDVLTTPTRQSAQKPREQHALPCTLAPRRETVTIWAQFLLVFVFGHPTSAFPEDHGIQCRAALVSGTPTRTRHLRSFHRPRGADRTVCSRAAAFRFAKLHGHLLRGERAVPRTLRGLGPANRHVELPHREP